MKEMIKALLDDGWAWVAKNKKEEGKHAMLNELQIFCTKPTLNEYDRYTCHGRSRRVSFPSCLFPDITFENSPVELKTLLVDDEEEEQSLLKSWVKENFIKETTGYDGYLIRDWNDDVLWVSKEENDACDAERLSRLCPNKYEKVYLKDLLKKRKVKKSVWLAIDEYDDISITETKPNRGNHFWLDNEGSIASEFSSKVFNMNWEDEPIELTYEVEE